MSVRVSSLVATAAVVVMAAAPVLAQTPQNQSKPPAQPQGTAAQQPAPAKDLVTVVTKEPEAPERLPAAVEIISGDELRARGAMNLRDALALAAGVEVAPGGDSGPAGSVPEFWGLREFDAFLLVVDGVPWGGAFNPALTTLNLRDVEKIEILRGAAPVSYGATSFVGVIHVVHKPGSFNKTYLDLRGGAYRTGGISFDTPVQKLGDWKARVSVDFERQGFADPRTSYGRGHALFRVSRETSSNKMWLVADLNLLRQSPNSPHPRDGATLSGAVPLDANANPGGAFMDDNRLSIAAGMDRQFRKTMLWSTTLSFSRSSQSLLRGFLTSLDESDSNASGLRENIGLTDFYADTHFVWPERHRIRFTAGGDFLHGQGKSEGAVFTYHTPLNGSLPTMVTVPTTLDLGNEDRREFVGAYAMAEFDWTPKLTLSGGIRANITFEERGGSAAEEAAAKAAGEKDKGQLNGQPSGMVGLVYRAWERNGNHVTVYGNYRGTFKPAAFDFGLGNEAGGIDPDKTLLSPETAQSIEGGAKSVWMNGRIDAEMSAFRMAFNNLVTSTVVNGLPALQNTGKTLFEGVEFAVAGKLPQSMSVRATYSFHNGRFVDFVQAFDGVPTQLGGKRFEMSARQLFSAGWLLTHDKGIVANVIIKYTGNRFLNKRNTALAPGFMTFDCGAGYRLDKMELRFDLRNLTNRRDPIAESELGDAQYYRMTARSWMFTIGMRY